MGVSSGITLVRLLHVIASVEPGLTLHQLSARSFFGAASRAGNSLPAKPDQHQTGVTIAKMQASSEGIMKMSDLRIPSPRPGACVLSLSFVVTLVFVVRTTGILQKDWRGRIEDRAASLSIRR